jgi:two-component system chemotaxis response regulator CheY
MSEPNTILAVDDSMVIRRIIQGAVETLGYDCLTASNGKEALAVLEEHAETVALVTLDWNMPEKDGLSTLKEIRTRWPQLPVMMVTTEAERQHIIEAIQLGARQYLTKPFTPEDLLTKMMGCLEAPV